MDPVLILIMSLPVIFSIFYFFMSWHFDYWRKKGIPSAEGTVPFGNIGDIVFMKKTMAQVYEDIYRDFSDKKMVGFFKIRKPILMVRDPELVQQVLVKDFSSFHDNDFVFDTELDPIFALNPFSISGERWKKVRSLFKQPQTPLKLKAMLPLAINVAKEMTEYLSKNNLKPLEAKYLCGNFTTDLVASCVFGVNSDCFKDTENEFRKNCSRVLNGELSVNIATLLSFYNPSLGKVLKFRIIQKDVHEFFTKVVTDVVKYRRKEGVSRHDFLQNLINDNIESEANGHGPVHSYDELTAHCMTFFLDGYNTSSIALSYTLYELAMNKEVQQTVREEILSKAKVIDQLNYDTLQSLDYLQMVISESLRLHPPVPVMTRRCTKNTVFQVNGENYEIEAGTPIAIPVLSLHMDEQYFPDPERFIPERFTSEEKSSRPHYVYLPFGEGPRICLGVKFANMVVTLALATIVMNYDVFPQDSKSKIEQDPASSFLYLAKGGVWLKFKRR